MPQKLLYHRHFQICAALIAADCLVFTVVNPMQANAMWLIIGYGLLGLTTFALANLLASAFKSYGEAPYHLSRRFLRYGAAVMVVLIGLQSIGQLTTKDIMTLLPFAVLAYLYFGYGRKTVVENA